MIEYPEQNAYMAEILRDVNDEQIKKWMDPENLVGKNRREFAGFEIVDSIDGGIDENREVSLVTLKAVDQYPQHIHKNSDAYFIITKGSAKLLSGREERIIMEGEKIEIPRGKPHGFEIAEGEQLEFISIQSPPIKNHETGEEDLHLTDII